MKAAIPDEPKQAAQDAVSSAKDSLPEAPGNPFQGLFSGKQTSCHSIHTSGLRLRKFPRRAVRVSTAARHIEDTCLSPWAEGTTFYGIIERKVLEQVAASPRRPHRMQPLQ